MWLWLWLWGGVCWTLFLGVFWDVKGGVGGLEREERARSEGEGEGEVIRGWREVRGRE